MWFISKSEDLKQITCLREVFVRVCVQALLCVFEHLHAFSLFALPEHQVHEATEESHGEADPCQDVGGSIRAVLKTYYMKGVFLSRVDGGCDQHTYSWGRRIEVTLSRSMNENILQQHKKNILEIN